MEKDHDPEQSGIFPEQIYQTLFHLLYWFNGLGAVLRPVRMEGERPCGTAERPNQVLCQHHDLCLRYAARRFNPLADATAAPQPPLQASPS